MAKQPRDSRGRFINRATWELAYQLAGQAVPKRVGSRNATAPLSSSEIQSRAARHPKVGKRVRQLGEKRPKGAAMRADVKAFPRGTEFELTVRYPKKQGKHARALHLKVRVELTSAMSDASAQQLVFRAFQDGEVPPGIALHHIDWSRGAGSETAERGTISDGMHQTLRQLFGAVTSKDREGLRFAPVRQ